MMQETSTTRPGYAQYSMAKRYICSYLPACEEVTFVFPENCSSRDIIITNKLPNAYFHTVCTCSVHTYVYYTLSLSQGGCMICNTCIYIYVVFVGYPYMYMYEARYWRTLSAYALGA